MAGHRRLAPSGNEAFDRARATCCTVPRRRGARLVRDRRGRADRSRDPRVGGRVRRRHPAGSRPAVGGRGLGRDRPRERGAPDLGDFLEAAARLQLGDGRGRAASCSPRVDDPTDPWFPCSVTAARIARAHTWRISTATSTPPRAEVLAAFEADPFAPDVWDAFARLCAETDFDPTEFVACVPDDRTFEVLAALRSSAPAGVDRIAELIWARNPGDPRVLALVPSFAAKLEGMRAMEWSARMRGAAWAASAPCSRRAEDEHVDATERVRACALAHASFGDRRARELLERGGAGSARRRVVAGRARGVGDRAGARRHGRRRPARPPRTVRSRSRRRCSRGARRARRTRCSCTACRSRRPRT